MIRAGFLGEVIEMCVSGGVGIFQEARRREKEIPERAAWVGGTGKRMPDSMGISEEGSASWNGWVYTSLPYE